MPQYDPQRSRPRQKLSDEDPAPVDALLESHPTPSAPAVDDAEVEIIASGGDVTVHAHGVDVEVHAGADEAPTSRDGKDLRGEISESENQAGECAAVDARRITIVTSAVVAAVIVLVWLRRRRSRR